VNITSDALRTIRANVDPRRLAAFDANCARLETIAKSSPTLPKPKMNKLEQAYALRLDAMKFNREIAGYEFEGHKLRLADKTSYTPDFVVWLPDGRVEYHETKGFERDDAAVKFKTAAEKYPYARFLMVRKATGGAWETMRDIPARVPAKGQL
jgi:hypothetical protein